MNISYTESYRKGLGKLPKEILRLLFIQEERFLRNWRDPRLQPTKISGEKDTFSFRVTRRYRVIFHFLSANEVVFVSVGHRKESYRRYG